MLTVRMVNLVNLLAQQIAMSVRQALRQRKKEKTTCRYACSAGRFQNITADPDPSLCDFKDCCSVPMEMYCSEDGTPVPIGKNCSSESGSFETFTCYKMGTYDCATCPDGKFAGGSESKTCTACPKGWYNPPVKNSQSVDDLDIRKEELGGKKELGGRRLEEFTFWFENVDESYRDKTRCTQCPEGQTTKSQGTALPTGSQNPPCDICKGMVYGKAL